MRISIKDCLGLPAFENAQLLACKELKDETVKNMSVMEANSVADIDGDFAESNQMLITGFYSVRNDVKTQCEIVEKLAEKGMVALVLHRVGEIMPFVSDELIECCKKNRVVLIQLDMENKKPLSEIIEEVSHSFFYRRGEDSYSNSLITNTIYHLLNFDKYADFQSAVKAAAVNNNFQFIILSTDFNPVLTIETQYRTTVEKAIRIGREKPLDKSVYTQIDIEGVLTYWGPITILGNNFYMFIVDNDDSFSRDEIIKLADIIQMAIGMWKYSPVRDQKAEFVKALRRGNINMAYSIKEEEDLDEERMISIFTGTGFSNGAMQKKIDEYCLEHGLQTLQVHEGDSTFGIVKGECSRSVCSKLFETAKSREGRLFHVTGIDGIEGACDAFKLINETWIYAQQVFPHKRSFSKYDLLLISNCNNIQLKGGFIKRNYMKLLEPFGADTSNKGKQLLDTLETFVLDAGMNGTKTAEIMDVHTNTVQYRLKKISELLGAEITANRVIPGLTIALVLKRLERV